MPIAISNTLAKGHESGLVPAKHIELTSDIYYSNFNISLDPETWLDRLVIDKQDHSGDQKSQESSSGTDKSL